jgi:hypothetical protein
MALRMVPGMTFFRMVPGITFLLHSRDTKLTSLTPGYARSFTAQVHTCVGE